jgi:enoyl-CoA hydratase/carnithine racemase
MEHSVVKKAGTQISKIAWREDDIAWIELNRPRKANALNSELLQDILDAMDAAEAEPGLRAVILCGEGAHFCAGADLGELLAGGVTSVRSLLNLFREVCSRFERSQLVVVGMAHGAVRAGGLELLLACDGVVGAEGLSIGDAHVLRELLPGGGSSVRLPRTIGHQRAKWLILTGATLSAQKACEWGILTTVAAETELRPAALDLARTMSVGDIQTVERLKSLMVSADTLPFEEALENEILLLEEHATTSKMMDGLRAFLRR